MHSPLNRTVGSAGELCGLSPSDVIDTVVPARLESYTCEVQGDSGLLVGDDKAGYDERMIEQDVSRGCQSGLEVYKVYIP